MAVQHTSSSHSDSAGGPTQGKSSHTQGSPQRGVSCTGSITSQPQLTPSHADLASSHACCSSSNSAQQAEQAVFHARGIALLREQSQAALGVQPSYDDLSREGLEEDNCRLRYALAAIELQLGVLRNQQVGHGIMRWTVRRFGHSFVAGITCMQSTWQHAFDSTTLLGVALTTFHIDATRLSSCLS